MPRRAQTRPAHPRARAGSALLSILIVLIALSLAVAISVMGGARTQALAGLYTQGERAQAAAEAAAAMGTREVFDALDRDADGTIGSISADNNAANDPTLSTSRVWATRAVSGATTTITAYAQLGDITRAQRAVLVSGADAPAATVLLVVANSAALDTQESAKLALIQSWGYTVTLISESATQSEFDAAWRAASVVYISETVTSGNVSTKLTNSTTPVITEESSLSDELGFSTSMTTITVNQMEITNSSHYITSGFSSSTITLFTAPQLLRYLSGTQGGYTTLGRQVGTTNVTLAVMERGATLTPSGQAAGRRVYLPWGNTSMDFAALTDDGKTLMRRAIEWCVQPIAHYKLDETSGSTASDAIASRHGTRSGGAWVAGRKDNAAFFNGITDYLEIPNDAVFQPTLSLSVAGWINASTWPTDLNLASIILRKGDANPNNWQVAVVGGRAAMILDDYDAYALLGNTTLPVNTWTHVAATWDGQFVRIYVDGVLDNTPVARSTAIGTDARALYIGGRIGNTDIVSGSVDDVRFYNRALTAQEVAALAAGGKPRITSWTAVAP